MFELLKDLKEKGFYPDKVLDVGAYNGEWSLSCQEIFGGSEYYLVEPENYNNDAPRFKVYKKHLSNKEEKRDWYSNKSSGDSLFKEATAHYTNVEPVQVECTTVDILFRDLVFGLVKIDTQGSELLIMEGGSKVLSQSEFIILEVPFAGEWNINAPKLWEYLKFMDEFGFDIYDTPSMTEHVVNGVKVQLDIFFVNKKSKYRNHIIDSIINSGK